MIIFTIIIGAIALITAHAVGITETRLGTAAITAIVLLLAITALPQCYWLFDSLAGWLTTLVLWAGATLFYHRILTDGRRSTPINADLRRAIVDIHIGGRRLAIAIAWGTN